jgi:arginase family enzyme
VFSDSTLFALLLGDRPPPINGILSMNITAHTQPLRRMFGVALDASDDPMSLELKSASLIRGGDRDLSADPYDALADQLDIDHRFELAGKLPVPSWLGPRPQPEDRNLLNPENFQRFYEEQGFLRLSEQVRDFVKEHIFPAIPIMIGIDHSSTGGVIAALADRYGAENISVIVIDRHFDAIALSQRVAALAGGKELAQSGPADMMPFSMMDTDQYCCGSFWAYVLDKGLLYPENLLFIGVADYPESEPAANWQRFCDSYLQFEERGCRFFPLCKFAQPYRDDLDKFIEGHIKTPYVYVSLDVDVGSFNCVHAARYMDGMGISRENLLDIAAALARLTSNGRAALVGFDVMEFNMHFLGIETGDGQYDRTLDVVNEFIQSLLADEDSVSESNASTKPRQQRVT